MANHPGPMGKGVATTTRGFHIRMSRHKQSAGFAIRLTLLDRVETLTDISRRDRRYFKRRIPVQRLCFESGLSGPTNGKAFDGRGYFLPYQGKRIGLDRIVCRADIGYLTIEDHHLEMDSRTKLELQLSDKHKVSVEILPKIRPGFWACDKCTSTLCLANISSTARNDSLLVPTGPYLYQRMLYTRRTHQHLIVVCCVGDVTIHPSLKTFYEIDANIPNFYQ